MPPAPPVNAPVPLVGIFATAVRLPILTAATVAGEELTHTP